MKKNNRAARAARKAFCCNFLTWSIMCQREIFIFKVLTTTRDRTRKSFILCLNMKTIRAKQANSRFAPLVQREQYGIVTKHLTQSSISL